MAPFTQPPKMGESNLGMLMPQTATQMMPITSVSWLPKSSSFCASGVFSASSLASCTPSWIFPISVLMPVAVTTAKAPPFVTMVPLKIMLALPWMGASASTGSVLLDTVTDSPVSEPSSTLNVVVFRPSNLASAGTLSPTRTKMTSPGTSSCAGSSPSHWPPRSAVATSGCSRFSASSESSALLLCHTPTIAFRMRMAKMTPGSMNPPSSPSRVASTALITATTSRICTRRSSNCSRTNFQRGVASAAVSSLRP
mmetsp:Transcript_5621/g.9023  ORF Transcript_5621/g.9023 Transcript_5621/m.9023 type:complete len:254 (-) Transcript_5621:536-1297(-)